MSKLSSSLKPMAASSSYRSAATTALASARSRHMVQDASEGTGSSWETSYNSKNNSKGRKTSKNKVSSAFTLIVTLLLLIIGCLAAYYTAPGPHVAPRVSPAAPPVARPKAIVGPPRIVHHGLMPRPSASAAKAAGASAPRLHGMRPNVSKHGRRVITQQVLEVAAEVAGPLVTFESKPLTANHTGSISPFAVSLIRGSVASTSAGASQTHGALVVSCAVAMSVLLRLVIKFRREGFKASARKAMIHDLKEHIKELHATYDDALLRKEASISELERQLAAAIEQAHTSHALLEQERVSRINNRHAALSRVQELTNAAATIKKKADDDASIIHKLKQERASVTGALTTLVKVLTDLKVIDGVAPGSNTASTAFLDQLAKAVAEKLGDQRRAVLDVLDTAEAQQSIIDMFRKLNESQYDLPPPRGMLADNNDALQTHLAALLSAMHSHET